MKFICPKCHAVDHLKTVRQAEAVCSVWFQETSEGTKAIVGAPVLSGVHAGSISYYCGKCGQELPMEGDYTNAFTHIVEYLAEEPYNNQPGTSGWRRKGPRMPPLWFIWICILLFAFAFFSWALMRVVEDIVYLITLRWETPFHAAWMAWDLFGLMSALLGMTGVLLGVRTAIDVRRKLAEEQREEEKEKKGNAKGRA